MKVTIRKENPDTNDTKAIVRAFLIDNAVSFMIN